MSTPPEDPYLGTATGPRYVPDRPLDAPPGRPSPRPPRRDGSIEASLRVALPWVVASVIVLALSVTAGFVTAYLVASGRAVQPPGFGLASPTPRQTAGVTLAPGETSQPSTEATVQPRRTPTPGPEITPEASPFVHVVQRRESLSYIAGLYCTTLDEILAINDIPNPNTIRPGDEILIPGSASCASPAP